MEHRWGQRSAADVPVRLTCHTGAVGRGRLMNASVSGAFVATDLDLPLLASVQVEIDLPPQTSRGALRIGAYVMRRSAAGFGLEWHELLTPQLAYAFATMQAAKVRGNLDTGNGEEVEQIGRENSSHRHVAALTRKIPFREESLIKWNIYLP